MLHVVPMFFYTCWRKSKQNDSLQMSAEASARQLVDLDENGPRTETRRTTGAGAQKEAPARVYEPMQKVPFMSLDLNLDETERSSDEDEGENEETGSARQMVQASPSLSEMEESSYQCGEIGEADSFGAVRNSGTFIQEPSLLLDLLSSNKELSASPAVVDLVARVSEETPESAGPSDSSPGSPASGAPKPTTKLHRTPIPSEIYCHTAARSETFDKCPANEILDPTDALIYGWIHNSYLRDVAEQMNRYFVTAEEDDDLTNICLETTRLIRHHPMTCQVKYKTPELDCFCYPLSYFSAAGWLEGCQAAYEAFPEAIGQDHDSQIGLPLHYACLYQANFEVVQFLVHTYAEATRVTNADHQTPLHQACRSKDVKLEVVQLLLRHYPTAAQLADLSGYTPLHLAIRNGASIEVLEALQSSSPTVIRTVTLSWYRPLHVAALFGASLEIVRWLVKKDPSAIKATSEDFSTVLHFAVVGRCSAEVVRFLRDCYPSALHLSNDNDETPFDVALNAPETSLKVLQLVCPPAPDIPQ